MKDMLKKFNTTETWIDVETLANLKGISKRAIRLSFNSKNSNYETKIENGKGGHLYKIRLSSIEEELQIKYIEDKLKHNPKILVVDEIDYLFSNRHTIETLRDIHDKLSIPILLVGMELADKKLQKYGHINDRIFTKLRFEKLSKDDFKEIIETLSEVNFCDKAIKYIANRNLQFRQVVKIIVKSEQLAQTNKLKPMLC